MPFEKRVTLPGSRISPAPDSQKSRGGRPAGTGPSVSFSRAKEEAARYLNQG